MKTDIDHWMETANPKIVKHLEIICVDRNGTEYGRVASSEFVDSDDKIDIVGLILRGVVFAEMKHARRMG